MIEPSICPFVALPARAYDDLGMSTLEEIELAARRLKPAERQRSLVSVAQTLREGGHPLPEPRQFSVSEMRTWMDEDEQDYKRFRGGN